MLSTNLIHDRLDKDTKKKCTKIILNEDEFNSLEENEVFYCRNDNSIGIEMCCKKDCNGNWYFEQNTIRNCIALAKQIVNKYKIPIENVLRHYDVTGKICPEPYIRNIELWNDFKKEVFKKEEYTMNTEIPQWKVECVKWLEKEGLISQNHKPDEPIDMGSLGAVLINLFEKYYITKK